LSDDSSTRQPYLTNELEAFTTALPGYPDNIRTSLDGNSYWIALFVTNTKADLTFIEQLYRIPNASKAVAAILRATGNALENIGNFIKDEDFNKVVQKVKSGILLVDAFPKKGILVEVDLAGNVLQTLHSEHHAKLTEAQEFEDGLYVGSFLNPYVLKVPRANYRRN